jgi:V-type H+-transporting ATPase subunit a
MILLSYPETPKSSAVFYTGQRGLQTFLIVLAVICIPWMLLGKPVYRIVMNKRRANVNIQIGKISLIHFFLLLERCCA